MKGEVDSDEEYEQDGSMGGYKKRRVRFSDEGAEAPAAAAKERYSVA